MTNLGPHELVLLLDLLHHLLLQAWDVACLVEMIIIPYIALRDWDGGGDGDGDGDVWNLRHHEVICHVISAADAVRLPVHINTRLLSDFKH